MIFSKILLYFNSFCSIRIFFHPYFNFYENWIQNRFSNKDELFQFLEVVKLREDKLKWALKQKDKKNIELASLCGIGLRRFLQLKSEYKKNGEIPKLNPQRRPKTFLNYEEIKLIDKVLLESKLTGAISIKLYILKYYNKDLPRGKIHQYLISKEVSKEDPKKKKQRKYCRYERKHSFSLGHTDYHESKCISGKQLIVWIDDASRYILSGGEFDEATTKNAIKIVKDAQKFAKEKYGTKLRELNTDKGSQFYANKTNNKREKGISEFEKFLNKEGIKHIPSRRNHPQTNGKNERWHRTYEEKRHLFDSFEEFIQWYNNRIHLGLSRTEGITPSEALYFKLPQECLWNIMFTKYWK